MTAQLESVDPAIGIVIKQAEGTPNGALRPVDSELCAVVTTPIDVVSVHNGDGATIETKRADRACLA